MVNEDYLVVFCVLAFPLKGEMEVVEHRVVESFEFYSDWYCVFVAELVQHFLFADFQNLFKGDSIAFWVGQSDLHLDVQGEQVDERGQGADVDLELMRLFKGDETVEEVAAGIDDAMLVPMLDIFKLKHRIIFDPFQMRELNLKSRGRL